MKSSQSCPGGQPRPAGFSVYQLKAALDLQERPFHNHGQISAENNRISISTLVGVCCHVNMLGEQKHSDYFDLNQWLHTTV